MASLWNRASPPQYRMLRAIAGAVMNTCDHHNMPRDSYFARGVAKRAVGTLTAQWPEVLAATANRRQNGTRDRLVSRGPRDSDPAEGCPKGDRLRLLRRSPIRTLWKRFAAGMWKVKLETPEVFAAHVRILKLLDEAQREYAAMLDHVGRMREPQ
jgi:hypothetical protein